MATCRIIKSTSISMRVFGVFSTCRDLFFYSWNLEVRIINMSPELVSVYIHNSYFTFFLAYFHQQIFFFLWQKPGSNNQKNFTSSIIATSVVTMCTSMPFFFYFLSGFYTANFCLHLYKLYFFSCKWFLYSRHLRISNHYDSFSSIIVISAITIWDTKYSRVVNDLEDSL